VNNHDWALIGKELASRHGSMSKAAAIYNVPYQNFQRLCQGRIKEPKFWVGLRILAGYGVVIFDEKELTLKWGTGTILPTQTERSDETQNHSEGSQAQA